MIRALDIRRTRLWPSVALVLVWLVVCWAGGAVALVPAVAFLLPATLSLGALWAGRVAALACGALAVAAGYLWGGPAGALAVALVTVPAPLYAVYAHDKKLPFWRSVLICAGALLLAGLLCVYMATRAVGGDLVLALRDTLEKLLGAWPQSDAFLSALYSAGVLTLPENLAAGLRVSSLLWPLARAELLKQFLTVFEAGERLAMPAQILTGAMLGGLFAAWLPRRYAATQAGRVPAAPMPPMRQWVLPRRVAVAMGGPLLLLGAAMLMSGSDALYAAFYVLWAGVRLVFVVQGAALVVFLLAKRSVRPRWRYTLVIALYLLFDNALLLAGIADQLMNIRRLRMPPGNTHDEEDEV
ncbi:MAG: hypothetical protein LBU67_07435 [Oscillospiraceae bacterium]|jgi:hypothetical protein|nr:hypothetical protein [Oscillospiraceae bacterium]